MGARFLHYWVNGFVVWVVLVSAAAWVFPAPFQALKPAIVPGLGIIMFGMGMSLRWEDFSRVLREPRAVLCGLLGQFLLMPMIAWIIAMSAGLPPELQLGFILVGCCPGGTASNVIVYLARGNVALSVTMTACSTVAGIVLTPLLTKLLGSQVIDVDAFALFKSVVIVVLIPVGAGLILHALYGARLARVVALFPAVCTMWRGCFLATDWRGPSACRPSTAVLSPSKWACRTAAWVWPCLQHISAYWPRFLPPLSVSFTT